MKRKFLLLGAALAAIGLIVVACSSPAPEPVEVTREVVVTSVVEVTAVPTGPEVPYEELWAGSAHNAVDTEPFRHWDGDTPAEVPTSCARCHSTAGYRDYLGDERVHARL